MPNIVEPATKEISLHSVLVGGALSRASFGIWFCWICFNGAILKRFRSEVGSLRAISKIIALVLIFFALCILPARPLQELLGPRWSCFLGTLFVSIGLLASAVSSNIWQFFIAAGAVVSLGCAIMFTPPLCFGFQHHPKHKGLICGVMNSGMLIGVAIGILLSVSLLRPWMNYGEGLVNDADTEPKCGGYFWTTAMLCRNLSVTTFTMGVVLGLIGTMGAFSIPDNNEAHQPAFRTKVNFHTVDQRRGAPPSSDGGESERGDEFNDLLSQGSRGSERLSDRQSMRSVEGGGRIDIGITTADAPTDWDAASLLSQDETRTTFHTTVTHHTHHTHRSHHTQHTRLAPPMLDSLPEDREQEVVPEIYEESVPWLVYTCVLSSVNKYIMYIMCQ
jgi:hypothetical protein